VLSAVSAARTLSVALVYPAVGAILDRSLVAALVFVGLLGLAAAALARAPARLFEEPGLLAPAGARSGSARSSGLPAGRGRG